MTAIPATEAIEVTDAPLPTGSFQLHCQEIDMKLDLPMASKAEDPDMCFFYAVLIQRAQKHPKMVKTITAVLQQLGNCNTTRISDQLRNRVQRWIEKTPKTVSAAIKATALEAWKKN
jgi:hypothetical protein